MKFYNTLKEICNKYKKVALFVDMDGTIVEYNVYPDGYITNQSKGLFLNQSPLDVVIENLKRVSTIENLEIYILSLSKSNIIIEEKKQWLKKYVPFIKESNYIILCRENGDYNSENREYIKSEKMKEKLEKYDYVILLDDEQKILRRTQKELADKGRVFHVSSAII